MKKDHSLRLAEKDVVLAKIMVEIPAPEIHSTRNVFHDLMSCIIEQQIHYRSTKRIFQKMLDRAHLERLTVDNFHLFEENSLGTVKLSMSKYATISRVLDFWQQQTVDWKALPDDEVVRILSSIKGIGSWTIDMMLLYTLERPNVFPEDDFRLKEIMVRLYGLNPAMKLKAQMTEIAENWEDQKSLAVLYLLAWKEYEKKHKLI